MAFCCPPKETSVCSFCPSGLTNPDLVLPTDGGVTCAMAMAYVSTITDIDPNCAKVNLAKALCCVPIPTVVDNICIICPGGATAGDDSAPCADTDVEIPLMIVGMVDNPSTCAELIDAAKQYESGSKGCPSSEIHKLYCCPSVPENPCIICPNGITHPDGDYHVSHLI